MPRVKVEYRSGAREVYDKFCLKYPESPLSYEEWESIIYTYNKLFRDYLLETGEKAKLPFGLGPFSINKKKTKKLKRYKDKEYVNLPIDWVKTRKEGKRIYNFNLHTDGYRFKWLWFPKDSRFYQANIWVFKPSRESSRKITEYLKKPQQTELYKQWQQSR
jgi:nucleoid DNA-binding protein